MNILTEDEITALRQDFKCYKELGTIRNSFGRNSLYNHPNGLPIIKTE